MSDNRKVMFSGIKPTGDPTLGNYLGAIKNWVSLQNTYQGIFSIVDLHAITVHQNPEDLKKRSIEIAAIYFAAGIDPKENIVFIQSHVHQHAEAAWLLTCNSYMGELNRMTQFKEKSSKSVKESVPTGIFAYPLLMAADILLYGAEVVPVGKDQVQHVELTRDLANRFNNTYSNVFKIPKPFVNTGSAKIYDLQDPTKKMSKSETSNPNGYILIMDSPDIIRKKISKAVTDSIGIVNYTDEQPGVKNLIDLVCCINGRESSEIVELFKEKGYKEFKEYVAETIINELEPLQNKVKFLLEDKHQIENILKEGARKASEISQKTLDEMKKNIGFYSIGE
ncbi:MULTISPECIES: tryptophan--tRNA ligase [Carnobacterium]|uniref:Tryptophan--tRNA ligase n=1 Tax=Carnobacterium inhibens TaxID=147709 RepID=A0ABR7T9H0_9LACT|nr:MULTISPECIES: tryptophan--tRNA ligase [Carnobacterium]MBC9824337.1 tryptophan--tRNA ligase [Carnobacterium inhibens]MDN5371232.1 tryptophanyl-tRNA synthetase [Carnobacterium sp.]